MRYIMNFKKNNILKVFMKIPTLDTPRLTLRRICIDDYLDMYDYSHREEVTRYLLWSPHPNEEYTHRYIEQLQTQYRIGEFYDWAVVCKENGKMIGTCGFTSFDLNHNRAEIGYVLNPDYWGRGIIPEAVCEVMRFGFCELRLNRIEAHYIFGNDRSRRVMEKCGMKFEGVMRSYMYIKNEYKDIGICSILNREYFNGAVKNETKTHY